MVVDGESDVEVFVEEGGSVLRRPTMSRLGESK